MIKRIFLYMVLVVAVSCSKDSDEFAVDNSQTGIVGRWKLVETQFDDGGGNIHVEDKSDKNEIISFDSAGKTTNNKFSCDGIYTFTPKEPNSPTGANLTVTFECNALDPKSETRKESFQAYIKDNNYLSLRNSRCIEPCAEIYRRLK